MTTSVLAITGPDGTLLSVDIGDTDQMHDLRDTRLKAAPAGSRSAIHPLGDTGCQHYAKARLAAADARLYRCIGDRDLGDGGGCGALFVPGRTWAEYDEPRWINTGRANVADFACDWCLDGFCTSVDRKPCPRCGANSARLVGGAS